MTDQQIMDCMAQIVRVGFVTARQPETHRLQVQFRDTTTAALTSDWLPCLVARASKDLAYDLPDIGDQVLCLFMPNGLEQGYVIGAMYGKQTPPVADAEKTHRTFKDGTVLEYDRAAHKLTIDVKGDVELTTTGNVTATVKGNLTSNITGPHAETAQGGVKMNAPSIAMGGMGGGTDSTIDGTLKVTGDVIAGGVSLMHHIHTCPSCGVTAEPVK